VWEIKIVWQVSKHEATELNSMYRFETNDKGERIKVSVEKRWTALPFCLSFLPEEMGRM
jgi:hypothetical protein